MCIRDRAHSWPEVYFPGYGWQRFEPTAAGYTSPPDRPEGPADEGSTSGANNPNMNRPPIDRDNPLLDDEGVTFLEPESQPVRASPLRALWVTLAVLGAVGLVVLGAGAALNLRVGHGLGRLSPVAATYERMCRWARVARLPMPESLTPREVACALGEVLPERYAALACIADLYTRERFGRRPALGAEVLAARQAWREVRVPLWQYPLRRMVRQIRAWLDKIALKLSPQEVSG